MKPTPPLWIACVPLVFLVALIACVVAVFGDETLSGASQIALLTATGLCVSLGLARHQLTWEDFEQYHGVECGSGLYIVRYEIDDDYELVIGGTTATGTPMYINLVRKDSEDEPGFIDIKTEDVQAFIDATR